MTDADQPRLWRITIPVIASPGAVEELTDRLVETLCPDTGHEGDCPIPWALHVTDGESLSTAEQRRLRDEVDDTNHG
jgi:hypothetical protein